jgi:hypothetical protein
MELMTLESLLWLKNLLLSVWLAYARATKGHLSWPKCIKKAQLSSEYRLLHDEELSDS